MSGNDRELMHIIRGVGTTTISNRLKSLIAIRVIPSPPGTRDWPLGFSTARLERTLTDEEVNDFHQEVLERLAQMPELVIR